MNGYLAAAVAVISLVVVGVLLLAGSASSVEAHRLVDEENARLIDVRTPEEYAGGHVPGAVNIPLDQLSSRMGEVGPKDAPVVLYCQSGRRSRMAAKHLKGAGFTAVHDLGPMSAW